jgi:hypothetical protein
VRRHSRARRIERYPQSAASIGYRVERIMKFNHMRGTAAFLQPNTGVTLPPPAWHIGG